jgi:hypothetical protein
MHSSWLLSRQQAPGRWAPRNGTDFSSWLLREALVAATDEMCMFDVYFSREQQ